MVYEAFLTEVKERMEHLLGEGYDLSLHKVPKNNGMILDGLCIARKNTCIAPAIYLNSCYEQYLRGRPMKDITKELLSLYYANETPSGLDYSCLADFDAIKEKIACRLVHRASNKALLAQVPYVSWQDLALVFYLCIQEDDDGLMTAMIHNQHLKLWNLSLPELQRLALHNSPRLFPPVISSITCILEELQEEFPDICFRESPSENAPMPFYVLTNSYGINGAVCMLYPDVLKNFAEGTKQDILILPSSIHEVLLLPDEGDISYDALSRLVARINHSEVPSQTIY